MGIDDRLLVLADEIRDATEEPVSFERLRLAIARFARVLRESDRIDARLRAAVNSAAAGLQGTPRPGFDDAYSREAIKAAFYLLGIYEATHGFE